MTLILFSHRLCCVFAAARRFSLVAASGSYSLAKVSRVSHCGHFSCGARALERVGFSSCRAQAQYRSLWALEHGFHCSRACGIFPDQGLNPCPLHWQADSHWIMGKVPKRSF